MVFRYGRCRPSAALHRSNARLGPSAFRADAAQILAYLSAAAERGSQRFKLGEAIVHGAVTHHRFSAPPPAMGLDRESVPRGSRSKIERDAVLPALRLAYERLARGSLGKEADAIAVSDDGSTLFVIETKQDAKDIGKAVGQVCWYAALFRAWAGAHPELAAAELRGLASARHRLGLAGPPADEIAIRRVASVIALPSTASAHVLDVTSPARELEGAFGHDGQAPLLWPVEVGFRHLPALLGRQPTAE